jgi:hypothetical protein
MKRLWKVLKIVVAAGVGVYVLAGIALYAVMCHGPATISAVFRRLPWPVFAALPIERMWLHARRGSLAVGEPAPDFDLSTFDRKSRVQLSSLRGRPVVLVFGSYT